MHFKINLLLFTAWNLAHGLREFGWRFLDFVEWDIKKC
jgi:hypothetical protein